MLIEYMITKLNSEWWVDVACINHVADFGLLDFGEKLEVAPRSSDSSTVLQNKLFY